MRYFAYLFLLTATAIFADSQHRRAADFVCNAAKTAGLNRLAVFVFTDGDGEENDATNAHGTAFLSALAACENLTIMDKSREEDVLDEQAFEQTGIVDENTMVPKAQLTGSDSLLFGISGPQGLELRLWNAKTGDPVAAQFFPEGGNPQAAAAGPDYYLKRWLVDSVRTQPPVYLFVTTTPAQWNTLCAKHPNLGRYYDNLSAPERQQLAVWRERIERLRAENRLPQNHDKQFRRDAVRISHEQTRGRRNGRFRQNRYHTRTVGRQARRPGMGERRFLRSGGRESGSGD